MIILNHIGKALGNPNLIIVHASGGITVGKLQIAPEKVGEITQLYYILPDDVRQALHCPNDVDEFELANGVRRWCHCTNHVGVPMFEVRTADAGVVGLAPLLMLDRLCSTMTDEEAQKYSIVAVFNTDSMRSEHKMYFGAIRWEN